MIFVVNIYQLVRPPVLVVDMFTRTSRPRPDSRWSTHRTLVDLYQGQAYRVSLDDGVAPDLHREANARQR